MNITVLDSETMGNDVDFSVLKKFGNLELYKTTSPDKVVERLEKTDIVILNKVKLGSDILSQCNNLKLICVFATGYDNIDVQFCGDNNIALCNVKGYSTDSVTQTTVALVLNLISKIKPYTRFVSTGEYTKSGFANKISPVFYELNGKTWGIVGLGAIGKKVAEVAQAFGCKVVANKNTPVDDFECVSLDELCERSDIISVHVPLNEKTEKLISEEKISKMKKDVILVNVARGAVFDEEAVCNAVINGKIGGLGVDVYSVEPFENDHPYNRILDNDNVMFTPHMAWAAFESRTRCLNEIVMNIESFIKNEKRNRII